MNENQPSRRSKKNAPSSGKGKGGGQKRRKKRGKKKSNKPAIDPKRPLWENPAGEAEVQAVVDSVRPAMHPTAIVRSLGEPPLGRYAGNAQHYYDAVYEKAQRFAVAIATANDLLVTDEMSDEPDVTDGTDGSDEPDGTDPGQGSVESP